MAMETEVPYSYADHLVPARVMSHFRTEGETRLRNQTKRISHVPTAGEIGALLLESKMIKHDFSSAGDLYGLFNSQRAALEHLMKMADENKLCYSRLGLEHSTNGKPCFRSQVKLCKPILSGTVEMVAL
jgi:excinuclease Cho